MKLLVAQCWDDGPYNDIRLTKLFKKYGAKATFNLCPGLLQEEAQLDQWVDTRTFQNWNYIGYDSGRVGLRDLAAVFDGFDLATHCWLHESAEDDLGIFLDSAIRTRNLLENKLQRECRGFAWPGGKNVPLAAKGLRKAGFAYARTVINTDHVLECKDTMLLNPSCHFQDAQFYQKFEAAKNVGVFYFWGHSYQMLDYTPLWQQFEAKLKYIANTPNAEWVNVIDLIPLIEESQK